MRLVHCRTLLIFICGFLFFSLSEVACKEENTSGESSIRLGFHFYKNGKIYDEAYEGIVDGLRLSDIQFEEFIYRSGRSVEQASKNLREMDKLNLHAIISFSSAGTRISQSLQLQTPVLASVINHPISLGLKEAENVQSNISGTSYYVDAKRQLDLYRDLFPGLKKIGMVYDEHNPAGYLAEEPLMQKACKERGLEFISVSATGRDDVAYATNLLLLKHVELIVIPTNLQIYDNLDLILEVTLPFRIPVVSMNKQGVEAGALASFFADTYKMGRQMEPIIRQIVDKSKKVSGIPFVFSEKPDLIINLQAAEKLDYEFNPSLLGRASIVIN